MIQKLRYLAAIGLMVMSSATSFGQSRRPAGGTDWKAELLAAREKAWRDFFGNPDGLAAALPEDFIAIDNGGSTFSNKAETVADSRASVAAGTKLVSLKFPETRIQRYGDVAVIYTTYEMVLARKDRTEPAISGRATEIFRWDGARWLHPGWHLDSGR